MVRIDDALRDACSTVAAECVCSNLRRAARSVTQSFDRVLRPSGIRASQMPILVALAIADRAPISLIGRQLGMDRTTLTRNLRPLERAGLVQVAGAPDDGRQRLAALTPAGVRALARALPLWRRAQAEALERLGGTRWPQLLPQIHSLTRPPSRG